MREWDRAEDMGSIRWAFRCGSWAPSRSDWLLAARCIQREEKERIGQFVFAKDAKSAMVGLTGNFLSACSKISVRGNKTSVCVCERPQAGRLLLRRFICEGMGVPWAEIRLERSPRGKPYLAAPLKVYHHSLTSVCAAVSSLSLYSYSCSASWEKHLAV